MRRSRTWFANALLVLAALTLTLLALEAGARLARRFETGTRGPGTTLAEYSQYDPLLGWRKRPGAQLRFKRREYDVQMAINSLGLRDPERGYEAAPGTLRILALGDSFVEGYSVELEQSMTQVLEASLGRSGCSAEVINGATTGYSTDQEYLFYLEEGARYAPKVVVLFLYYNDILYNELQFYTGGVPKPVFVFREGGLELYETPVPKPTPTPAVPGGAREDDQEGEVPPRSALLEWIRARLWYGAPRAYNAIGGLGLWPPNRPLGARLEMRVYQRKSIAEIEGAWEKTAALLDALARAVVERGSRFLVAYIPNRMEVDDSAWRLSQVRYGMNDADWDRGLVVQRLRLVADASGISFLDLTPALERASGGLLGGPYYPYDGHWNPSGHRVVAGEIERHLRELGWLSACDVPGR